MRSIIGIMGGFVVSFGMFVGGLWYATTLLTAEPDRQPGPGLDVADLWAQEPVSVQTAEQKLERVPSRQAPPAPTASADVLTGDEAGETTPAVEVAQLSAPEAEAVALDVESAVAEEPVSATLADEPIETEESPDPVASLPSAHVEWCASRYLSYRESSNSYTSYSGEERACVSPYAEGVETADLAGSVEEEAQLEDTSSVLLVNASYNEAADLFVTPDHVEYCFNRYRSYRPEDNSYQPLDGGPRQQCR